MATTMDKPTYLQHKVRPEVKQWIEEESKTQERSQAWFLNKLIEDAYAAAQAKKQGAST